MIIPGEGGVGKSKTIQSITENFYRLGKGDLLVKGAYTGIASSVIDGKTLHVLAMIPLNGRQQSSQTQKKLVDFWQSKQYFIINEMSMVSQDLFAKLSRIISQARKSNELSNTDQPFGGMNVILVGDFHQFPPVVTKKSAPLYWPCNSLKDTTNEILGRQIYEQFDVVVQLKTQVRVIDPDWVELLQHVRHGNCKERHLRLLRDMILGHANCPPTDFTTAPWNQAVLITPRHAVRMQWNTMMANTQCKLKSKSRQSLDEVICINR